MMSVGSQSAVRVGQPEDLWVAALIATLSASLAALFVSEPSLFIAGLFALLAIASVLRLDFFVYAMVFLLPWCPLVNVNLPVRNVFEVLRVVLFVGVWVRLRKKNKSVREWLLGSKVKKGISLFAGIAIASILLSGVPANLPSYQSLALFASYLATFFAVGGWLEDRNQLVRVLKLLLISTIGLALFGFYQAISGGYTDLYFRIYPYQQLNVAPWSGRITSLLLHFNSLAGYLNLVIPFAAACAVLAKDRSLKWLGLVCACLSAVAVFLTQSRGGLLALVGVLIISVWLLVPRLIMRINILCGCALACVSLLPPLLNSFERLQGVDEFTEVTRLLTWQAATALFFQHPFLGVGYGNYRFLAGDLVEGAQPGTLDAHNLYLQLLAETGLVGFLSFTILLCAFLVLSLKWLHEQDPLSRIVAFGVCGAIAATLIHGMVDYLFHASPQFGTLFWLVLGLGSCAGVGSAQRISISAMP